jgi:cytochrome c-type biogenesis protein
VLPVPERLVAPGLVGGAHRRSSGMLLGAAFAVCAAPCVGPVLASILLLAGDSSTALQGSLLLFAYSLGLAVPFLLAGIAFTRAMGAFRWLRDHYTVIRVVSGAILVALGLLMFFDRYWWLRVGFNRALNVFGLGV